MGPSPSTVAASGITVRVVSKVKVSLIRELLADSATFARTCVDAVGTVCVLAMTESLTDSGLFSGTAIVVIAKA